MDFASILGVLTGIGVFYYGMSESHSLTVFLNWHGILLVFGGTLSAVLINASFSVLFQALRAAITIFLPKRNPAVEKAVPLMVNLAERARRDGMASIQDEGQNFGDGFLSKTLDVALGSGDERFVRKVLEDTVNNIRQRHREIANIFRTMAVLAPMFGLLGTLMGIVQVLQNITEPQTIGAAMAVALSSAFYGILFANLICVPIAGKLRMRSLDECLLKEVIVEGIIEIIFTNRIPMLIEQHLISYVRAKEQAAAMKAPEVAGVTEGAGR